MLFLGVPTGFYDYLIVSAISIVVVIALLIIGLWYMYKSRVIKKGSAIPVLCLLLAILTPILILFMPQLLGGWTGGYTNATTIMLWSLGILVVVFVIFIYLIRSKKKILEEAGELRPKTEEEREPNEAGLKFGAAVIFVGALVVLLMNIFGLNWITYGNFLLRILIIAVASLIIIGSVYSLNRKKFATFGSIICVVGGASIIAFSLYLQIFLYGSVFFSIIELIPILLGGLAIVGVVLHYTGRKVGGILCVFMGAANLAANFIFMGFGGGGFLTIYYTIQLEPILMIIGGYFLYQELLST